VVAQQILLVLRLAPLAVTRLAGFGDLSLGDPERRPTTAVQAAAGATTVSPLVGVVDGDWTGLIRHAQLSSFWRMAATPPRHGLLLHTTMAWLCAERSFVRMLGVSLVVGGVLFAFCYISSRALPDVSLDHLDVVLSSSWLSLSASHTTSARPPFAARGDNRAGDRQ
jgi:hypothetical protein